MKSLKICLEASCLWRKAEKQKASENPPKRPKKEKASEKLKSGASEVPSIQEL